MPNIKERLTKLWKLYGRYSVSWILMLFAMGCGFALLKWNVPIFREFLGASIVYGIPMILLSLGLSLVIAQGGIDLSVGGVATAAGAIFAICITKIESHIWGISVGVFSALLFGATSGLVLSWSINSRKAPPLIFSWAQGLILVSCCLLIGQFKLWNLTKATTSGISVVSPITLSTSFSFASTLFGLICALCFMIGYWNIPQRLAAVGANRDSASYIGINSDRAVTLSYCACGILAAMSGVYSVLLMNKASFDSLLGKELVAIAICVLGGSSLSGGYISLYAVLASAIFYSITIRSLHVINPGNPVAHAQISSAILAGIFILICLCFGRYLNSQTHSIQVQRQTK